MLHFFSAVFLLHLRTPRTYRLTKWLGLYIFHAPRRFFFRHAHPPLCVASPHAVHCSLFFIRIANEYTQRWNSFLHPMPLHRRCKGAKKLNDIKKVSDCIFSVKRLCIYFTPSVYCRRHGVYQGTGEWNGEEVYCTAQYCKTIGSKTCGEEDCTPHAVSLT